jgi:hypothetical protein
VEGTRRDDGLEQHPRGAVTHAARARGDGRDRNRDGGPGAGSLRPSRAEGSRGDRAGDSTANVVAIVVAVDFATVPVAVPAGSGIAAGDSVRNGR